jgi:hypothetical protein
MNVSTTIWIATIGILIAAFVLDFVVVDARFLFGTISELSTDNSSWQAG